MAIESVELTKRYRGGILALNRVSFRVERGTITSLLGRNGAGKTTFVRIASTQLTPTSGTVKILGYDVLNEVDKVREVIACLPQGSEPISFLTPRELIYGCLLMRGFSFKEAKVRTLEVLKVLRLKEFSEVITSRLSGGFKKRVLLGVVIATDAQVMFLDEPTAGLDPLGKRHVWSILRKLRQEGRTIFITTQDMDEAELVSDEVAIIDRGHMLIKAPVSQIVSKVDGEVAVEVGGGFTKVELEAYGAPYETSGSFILYMNRDSAQELVKKALERKVKVSVRSISLEDAFLSLTGGLIESGETG